MFSNIDSLEPCPIIESANYYLSGVCSYWGIGKGVMLVNEKKG